MKSYYKAMETVGNGWGFWTASGKSDGYATEREAQRFADKTEAQDRQEAKAGKGAIALAMRKFFEEIEKPILFQGAMVKAILADEKTQTRRVCKATTQNAADILGAAIMDDLVAGGDTHEFEAWKRLGCPFGSPGNYLWVKETHALIKNDTDILGANPWRVAYRADRDSTSAFDGSWRPSIFCRREFSRIDLRIISTRVERLSDISEEDAMAEGVREENVIIGAHCAGGSHQEILGDRYFLDGIDDQFETAAEAYRYLWNSINLKPKETGDGEYISYPWSNEDFDEKFPGVRIAGIYKGKELTVIADTFVHVVEFRRVRA